jgi:hypothetical protein
MSAPNFRRLFLGSPLALTVASLLFSACAGQGDINRVQPDVIDKSIFFEADGVTPRKFYYRQTITGVPPTTAWAFEGLMGDMEKVRFQITEANLIGYRAYDYAAGSQNPTTGGDNNNDTPVLVYGILSHFDVKREYNAATGEETNVISENEKDRPWNQRQYMRVDWSENLADPNSYEPTPGLIGSSKSTGLFISQGDDPLFNPNRPVFGRDYIEFTHVMDRNPDYYACYRMFGAADEVGPWGCGNAQITFRNSLLPVPNSEYEPLAYPDRQVIRDADGTPIRIAYGGPTGILPCQADLLKANGLTGDDCTEAALDQFAKFGFFRTVRPTYDRQVGATQEGRQYFINRWNIWQQTIQRGLDGNLVLDSTTKEPVRIAIEDRKTREIVYYLNPEFPADPELRKMADTVVGDWNQAMKETVAGQLLTTAGLPNRPELKTCKDIQDKVGNAGPSLPDLQGCAASLPDIIKLKENDCSLANVKAFLTANPDVKSAVESRDTGHVLDLDNLPPADLLKACTALEVVTQNRADGDANHPKFTWQRNGDLRYSFVHWVDRPQVQGPLGYGPSSADPETGEIISAGAYIYGAALDIYAKFATDSVRLANMQLSTDDLLSGKTISDVLAESAATTSTHLKEKMTDAARSAVNARLRALGPTRDDRLIKVGAGIDDTAMKAVKGTAAEKLLLNDDVLPAVIRGYRPGDAVPDDVFDQAMAKPWLSSQAREDRRARFQTFSQHGCVYMAEFADDAILGTALELGKMGLSPDEMFHELRVRIFRGLTDHEVGHTMGLRHNFSASTDALNYADEYWNIRDTVPDQKKWDSDYKISEYAYASVMDYGARFNSDIQGLGKYDTAAIRFGYGQLFDLIVKSAESGNRLRNDITLWDYSNLPLITGGTANFNAKTTTIARYSDYVDMWTKQFRALKKDPNAPVTVYRERPYKFCDDLFEGNLDCKTWDRGANQQEIVANVTEQFRNYYAFNAYRRGRNNWDIDLYLTRLEERYFNRYSESFQFFFFLSDYLQYDLGADLFLASVDSLNAIAAILQTPEPGVHCPTALSPTVATFPVDDYGYIDESLCLPNKPKLDIQMPDAKPFYINFSDDYYYTFTRVGSLLEKLEALNALTSTESRFFRVDELSDVAARSSINYYRIFRDEVVKLLSGVIRNDPANYAATFGDDPQNPTFTPMPVVDLSTYGYVNPTTPTYAQNGSVHILTPVNKSIRYWALLFGLGRLGSSWDTTLDFQNFLAIGVKGADDDFVTNTAGTVLEYTHPETGIVFRATTNGGGAAPNIGRQLIDELNAITGTAGTTNGTIPLSITSYSDGTPLPNWYAAKKALDDAAGGIDQDAYNAAISTFNYVNYLVGYRIDLIGDIRLFRKLLLLP